MDQAPVKISRQTSGPPTHRPWRNRRTRNVIPPNPVTNKPPSTCEGSGAADRVGPLMVKLSKANWVPFPSKPADVPPEEMNSTEVTSGRLNETKSGFCVVSV